MAREQTDCIARISLKLFEIYLECLARCRFCHVVFSCMIAAIIKQILLTVHLFETKFLVFSLSSQQRERERGAPCDLLFSL